MADNPSRPERPPPSRPPEQSLKPTPEFQQKLKDLRAQKEAKQHPWDSDMTPHSKDSGTAQRSREAPSPQDTVTTQRPQDSQGPQDLPTAQRPKDGQRQQDSVTGQPIQDSGIAQSTQDVSTVGGRDATAPAAEGVRIATAPAGDGNRSAQLPAGEQAGGHADVRQAAAAERATSARDGAAERDDAKVPTGIVDEIASSPVDIRTKPHVNSAGEAVDRYIIDDAEDLLPVAEHFGINELTHQKDDYYAGQLPDGRYRKIEWNLEGHPNTDEGPHVKVMETDDPSSPPSRGNRWKTKAMIFVEGHEQYKKQWH